MGLSNSVYYLHGCCLYHQWENVVWEGGQGWNGLLAFITSCRERLSALETQVHQTLRQLHWGNKGQREGEAGMSLLDQLIGQPETEEQLRKPVALFSEVQRWRPKVHKTEFLLHKSGIFLSFLFFPAAGFEQFKTTFRFQYCTKIYYLYPCIWNLYQHWHIPWKGFSKDLHFQAKTEYL